MKALTREVARIAKGEARDPFAIATAQAQEMGYSDFSEGSPGEAKRDEIAEAIKKKSLGPLSEISGFVKELLNR